MSKYFSLSIAALISLGSLSGCTPTESEPSNAETVTEEEEGHTHEGDDVLFWQREGIEHAGFTIKLGHHGVKLYTEHTVEPAVSILKDGQPVADAKVFNCLVSAEEEDKVLADEVSTVYEPPTDKEIAHYAQGDLDVPAGVKNVIIRFRIVLPGDGGEFTQDVPVPVESH